MEAKRQNDRGFAWLPEDTGRGTAEYRRQDRLIASFQLERHAGIWGVVGHAKCASLEPPPSGPRPTQTPG
jgi:hypothetical protein